MLAMARVATHRTMRPMFVTIVSAVAIALACAWLASRYMALSVDARYSLAWGAELARGRVPDLTAPQLTTPHPLPIAVAALLSPLGAPAAGNAYGLLMVLSFALLLYAVFRLGRTLGGLAAGVIGMLIVATRPRLGFFAAHGFVDVPFTALVLLASAFAAEAPRRNAPGVLALLALAGLLRPEAWGLALLYGAFAVLAARATESLRPLTLAALAVLAPLAWLNFDLALTGDALHSLNGTRSGAVALDRVTGEEQLRPALEAGIETLVGWPVALAGVVVAAWGLATGRGGARTAFAVAAALVAAGIAAFGVLAYADLPLNDRYVLVPALGLACLAGAGAAGFHPDRPAARRAGSRLGAQLAQLSPVPLAALAFALYGVTSTAEADYRETSHMLSLSRQKHEADLDLERLLARPDVLVALRRCSGVTASGTGRAAAAALLELDPARVPISRNPVPPAGAAAISTAGSVRLSTPGVTREGAWALVERCA